MRVLHKYIIREHLRIFFIALGIFQSIYIIVDLFERADEITTNNVSLGVVLQFFAAKTPLIIFQVTPVAILLATVLMLTHLSKNHELTAIKAGGISFNQVIKPVLVIGLLVSLITLLANETMLPWTNQMVKKGKRLIRGKPPLERFHKNRIWMRGDRNLIINIQDIDPENKKIFGVNAYLVDDNFGVKKKINAECVTWVKGKWLFENGFIRYLGYNDGNKFERFSKKIISLDRDFDDFLYVKKEPDEMNYMELKEYIHTLKENGYKSEKYMVDLYGKLSIPFSSLVMVLIAIPFSVQSPRSGSFSGIGICIGIGFAYWLFLSFGLSLGHKGAISPFIGAWMGNIVFSALAIYLLRGKRVHFF